MAENRFCKALLVDRTVKLIVIETGMCVLNKEAELMLMVVWDLRLM